MTQLVIPTKKHPDEVLLLEHDWAQALVTGDSLSSVTFTTLSGDIVIDSSSVVGTKSQYWVSGGTTNTVYRLEADTATGRTYVEDVLVRIRS